MTQTAPLKRIASINDEALPEDTPSDREIDYIDIGSVGTGRLVEEPSSMLFGDAPSRARRIVRHGDTIVSTVRTYLKAVLPIEHGLDGRIASTGFAVVRPRDVDAGYLGWVLQSEPFVDEVVSRSVGVSYPSINPSQLGSIHMPTPSYDKQRRIADFLDTETARIDALIEAKESLIGLVAEKREAAVRAEMTFPEEVMTKLRYICRVKRGQSPRPIDDPRYFDEAGSHGWVRIEDVTRSSMYLRETKQRLSEVGKARSVPVGPGVVLVSIAASVGKPVITAMDCCYHDGFVGLLGLDADPEFAFYWLSLPERFAGTEQIGTQANINSDIVGSASFPDVSLEEQRRIARDLGRKLALLDDLSRDVSQQLTLLAEYRQALITAAVTGQLDEAMLNGSRPVVDDVSVEVPS